MNKVGVVMQNWVEELNLERHIEGGYYNRFYKSDEKVISIKNRHTIDLANERAAGSAIYFLLDRHDFSAWHMLKSDEIWHFYDGESALNIHTINQEGLHQIKVLGHPKLAKGASFQVLVKANTWFAADLQNKSSFSLVGCTVFPGFEYQDFILAEREKLTREYPKHAEIIKQFTHEKITAELDNKC
jgi:uncharacterized protein